MIDYLRIRLDGRRAAMADRGASAVEYALLVAGIAAVIIAAVFLFYGKIANIFGDTGNCLQSPSATSNASTC